MRLRTDGAGRHWMSLGAARKAETSTAPPVSLPAPHLVERRLGKNNDIYRYTMQLQFIYVEQAVKHVLHLPPTQPPWRHITDHLQLRILRFAIIEHLIPSTAFIVPS